jgi:hypothetical protein
VARTGAPCVEPIGYPSIPEKSPLNRYATGPCPSKYHHEQKGLFLRGDCTFSQFPHCFSLCRSIKLNLQTHVLGKSIHHFKEARHAGCQHQVRKRADT